MLSQTAEHAVRALLYLASRPAGQAASTDEIATAVGAPRNYLAKTLNHLAKHGMVTGTRGPGGGFRLEHEPAEIGVYRIVEAFDPPAQRRVCLLGERLCHEGEPCIAHHHWVGMWDRAMAPLRDTTLADLLSPSPPTG